jgi:sulfur carrier protein ThiS
MRIEVRLYATLRRYAPSAAEGVLTLDVPEGGRAADAIAKAGIDADEVHIVLINGASSPPDRVLGEGDRLGLFPAIGGG